MKMLCDRVKELESHKEEFKAELGASATVHERLRILEKEIFEDADAYEDACQRHKESEIPVKEKPVERPAEVEPDPYSYKPRKVDNYEYPQYPLDGLELNCLQVALDHLLEHLEDNPDEEEIEARISCTKNLINFIKRCENEHGTLTF